MKQLKFFKSGEAPIYPKRGTKASAGIDFFVPCLENPDDSYLVELKQKTIEKLGNMKNDGLLVSFLSHAEDAYKKKDNGRLFWTHVVWYNYALFGNNLSVDSLCESKSMVIPAGEHIVIPTGISANIPEGYCITMLNKSGIATKKSLLLGAQLVDEDYTGIIHLDVHNVSNDDVEITMGDKLAQGVIMESHCYDFELVNCEGDNDKGDTERGSGGFGSTGTK